MWRVPSATLWITTAALEAAQAEGSTHAPEESGGVLLGWRGPARSEYVVTDLLGPGPGASHERTRFEPDYPWQERQIADRYEASGRRVTYLGDWHTHPGGPARPSRRDVRTLVTIARSPAARIPDPIMVVLGGGGPWRPAAWRLREFGLRPFLYPTASPVRLRLWDADPVGIS